MKQCVTKLNRAVCAALVAFTLPTLAATPTITGVTAQQRYPWNGKFDISYTASGVDEACKEQNMTASLYVYAVEQTTNVMNVAESAYLSGDTTMADGTHTFVWDMDSQGIFQGLVSTNFEIVVSVEMQAQEKPFGGVQLWENGPYWAECNIGATKPEEYGYYFWWGDTVGYTNTGSAWISVKDGTTISFNLGAPPSFHSSPADSTCRKNNATLLNEGYTDSTGNLVAAHDAATAHLGGPWRMPTSDEVLLLFYNCENSWITMNGVSGRRFTGRGKYASKSIFLPAAGYGSESSLINLNSEGHYWSSTSDPGNSNLAWEIYLHRNLISWFSYSSRCSGQPVRPLRPKKVLYSNRSGAIRADLRTGEFRTATETEMLTYSTEWDGGETVTLSVDGTALGGVRTGSGTVVWTPPSKEGTYVLTHTVVTNGCTVILSATFCVRGVRAQQRYPWNGKFDIEYTMSGVAAACQEQGKSVSLNVFAVEQTTHVTNVAEAAYLSGDTTMTDGTHKFVWDMDAQGIFQGVVSTNFEIFVSAETGVQLWENGPYWAECNVGATKPEEYGYYFSWGDTNAYVRNANNDGWVSVKDGATLVDGFVSSNSSTYMKDNATLLNEGYIDSTGNLVAAHDAATAQLGGSWRMPTSDEIQALVDNCAMSLISTNGVSGYIVTGKGSFASRSIFLPAAGTGDGVILSEQGTTGDFWSSTPYLGISDWAVFLYFYSGRTFRCYGSCRYYGHCVRAIREFYQKKKVIYSDDFYSGRTGAIRADLRTGKVRTAAATEALTYSTAWDGGETATIQANGETLCQKTDSGIYEWAPTVGGTYALTHTTVTSEEPVVLTAQFAVPYQMGDTTWAVVTNGVCSIYGTGVMKGCDAGDKSPLYAFRSSITNLVIENGVTSIGDRLFENFWYLQRVTLAASVTNVGARAFKKCYGLTAVTSRAKGETTVDDYAFAGCHSLQRLYFAGTPTFGTEAYSFQTAIYMKDGGIPKVYTKPTIRVSGMTGHILGKKALDDAEWTDVTAFSDDAKKEYHFFKIEMR